jgi:methionine synthase / methylenetetrahydrofolate reductase (NADH)
VSGFAGAIGRRVLVCDGAMGTMLHAAGNALDRALPELNLSDPKLVGAIHESYLSAGADIIQTNTFGANRLWLADHGHPDKLEEINRAGVRIAHEAREQAGREVFVAGSVSPAVTALARRRVGAAERMDIIGEQVRALAAEGVDLLILETFGYLDELAEAVAVASDNCGVPIVAQATFADDGRTLGGETPHEVAAVLSDLPVAMVGTNCTIGPQRMLTVVEDLLRYASVPVSAQPNAGQPRRVGHRRFEFNIDGTYFARYLRRFADAGVCLVGGCCGTTPTHIGVAAARVSDLSRDGAALAPAPVTPPPAAAHAPDRASPGTGVLAGRLASRSFVVAAEIAAPAGGTGSVPRDPVDTVTALQHRAAQPVDLFAVTARENARAHLDSLSTALHLQDHAGVETIVTVTTWDKTIMTLQADLLGAHALGIRNVVCETGSPPVSGDYPAVDGVWEVDSLGLAGLLAGLNAGRDSNGLALTTRTSFCIGARINPSAQDMAAEIARVRAEVRAGARFLITRPVYELDSLRRMLAGLDVGNVPVLLSVAPLRSFEEADYLAHEVPEVNIPAQTLRAMQRAGRGAARAAGVSFAAGLLQEARALVDGVVLTVFDEDAALLDPLFAAVTGVA